ncbi:MAG: hypothetical protein IRY98_11910 [Alicyclobacillaceae bacterium]|nr:hypothetical protein [Alicyclobacillaceae bacterium]
MDGEWIRLEHLEIPGCKVFVRPTSYLLMSEEEREAAWARDVAECRYPVNMWIAVMRDMQMRKLAASRERW